MSFDVFGCLVCGRLVFSCLAGPFIARCAGGPTVSIAFWSKFCPVDFVILLPVRYFFLVLHIRQCLIPFLKPRVFTPFFNKGMAALKSPPKILLSPCPL